MSLTQAELKEVLDYNPETGIFIWKKTMNNNAKKGKIAGWVSFYGYIEIRYDNKNYKAHRLAWLYMMGRFPNFQIDHKNTIKNDNRIDNLRDTTAAINNQNTRKCLKNSSTGFLGVIPKRGKFVACIGVNYKKIHLGVFESPEEAHEAYLKAKRVLHQGCTI